VRSLKQIKYELVTLEFYLMLQIFIVYRTGTLRIIVFIHINQVN
jgi:hypothetical protein